MAASRKREIELQVLSVSRFSLDGGAMFGVVPRVLWSRQAPPDDLGRIEMVSRVLVARYRSPDRLVVVDSGMGMNWSDEELKRYGIERDGPGLEAALAGVGIAPDEVTDAIVTHLHFDHAGGWVKADSEGEMTPILPRAAHHVQGAHLEWARDPSPRDRGSFIAEHWRPLERAGLLNPLEGGTDIFDGLGVLVSNGHTPSMQMPVLTGERGTLVYPSDLIPMLAHGAPAWIMAYDLRPLVSLREKTGLLERALGENWTLVLEHDPVHEAATVVSGDRGPILESCECPARL